MAFNFEKTKQVEIKRFIDNSKIFKTEWDIYYLGLIMGFAHGSPLKIQAKHKFIDKYIKDYEPQQWNIISLLLTTYAENIGVKPKEKSEIMKLVKQLFDYRNITNLSDKNREKDIDTEIYGIELLNDYANRGIDIISKEVEFNGEDHFFLTSYFELLNSYIEKNKS